MTPPSKPLNTTVFARNADEAMEKGAEKLGVKMIKKPREFWIELRNADHYGHLAFNACHRSDEQDYVHVREVTDEINDKRINEIAIDWCDDNYEHDGECEQLIKAFKAGYSAAMKESGK